MQILLEPYHAISWHSVEPAYAQGGEGNDEWETFAEIILGWSGEHGHLSNESLNYMQTAHDLIPYEKLYGKKSDLFHVGIFSSIDFVHIPNEKRQKLDPKSEKNILVGLSLEQKGYTCFNPSTKKVRVSRDLVFNELAS